MDMNQYLDMFIEESKEHLQAINENLLSLEQNPQSLDIINVVFRSAHTLKGMAATMGFEKMAHLTHDMENGLDLMRNGKLSVTQYAMDVLFSCVDVLETQLNQIIETGTDAGVNVDSLVEQLKAIASGKPVAAATPAPAVAAANVVVPPDATGTGNLSLNEYESTILQQSKEKGFIAYQINVELEEKCVMRAARAYMVFDAYERIGEIIKSDPRVEDLEEEKFENEFMLVLVTQEDVEKVRKAGLNVSEVSNVTVTVIDVHVSAPEAVVAIPQIAPIIQAAQQVAATSAPVAAAPKASVQETTKKPQLGKSVRVDIERLDVLINLFSELVIDRTRLEQIARDLGNQSLYETVEHMSRISTDLQNIVMTIRMVPVETVFNRFPRMVRDLARDLNKKVNFVIRGQETELDRTVIDEIGDPLVHLLRNSLDHGLEKPEARLQNGKDETGLVELVAFHSGNHVFIEITDDGNGINRQGVLKKALEKGVVDQFTAENMTDQQVYDLLFHSGFSTAEVISDVSGRGVGLDVVKTKIESLGGRVLVQSTPGKGTKFSIQLPLTLSIIQAMLVQIADEKYAIPLSSIIETAIINKADIKKVHKQAVIDFRGRVVPLLSLEDIFSIPRPDQQNLDEQNVVIVRKGDKMAALVVDSFIGQQEVVLKSLGKYLTGGVFAISGATILGDGQVALIMDCNALIH
ncbi:chemotaxis protein CheA [Tumebacillus permanentifrigoris]|uniref:Chemotaxis protein CheA n=1 Tax=Tumebacillus permanentifrigoris TaxID=378543 RepID=A0A316D9S9_9BACL|nr:chemotaxis protein CheA [Tumebacillus permanentifrigoris]PWK12691.1 two-component system chemotaxis sensor kinase CheA [Tumebacillus permanentifrigoris]